MELFECVSLTLGCKMFLTMFYVLAFQAKFLLTFEHAYQRYQRDVVFVCWLRGFNFTLGAILLCIFLAFQYDTLGLSMMTSFKKGSSCQMDQCLNRIPSIFLYLVWDCVVNCMICAWLLLFFSFWGGFL